ncbi:MAG: putative transposase [Chlamydiales bacterium]|jgi:putative transposase
MTELLRILLQFLWAACRSRRELALENLALRQQLCVAVRHMKRSNLRHGDRLFWVALARYWHRWHDVITIVKPETIVAWHHLGFRFYWRKKSTSKPGRPRIARELRDLIRKMNLANPLWGAPKIHGELLKLGIEVSQATISRYMPRRETKPGQRCKTFLDNHVQDLASIDFFTVPTATFRVLYVLLVLSHDRRRIVHFNVTANPTSAWTGQQIREAFPWDTAPKYLLRDRDGIYRGAEFTGAVTSTGAKELKSAPRSPWQNLYVERLIGSIRRECLDHVIVFNERHVRRVLNKYFDYYHRSRTHLSLGKDAPETRPVELPESGPIRAVPQVGGLHHRYTRGAA